MGENYKKHSLDDDFFRELILEWLPDSETLVYTHETNTAPSTKLIISVDKDTREVDVREGKTFEGFFKDNYAEAFVECVDFGCNDRYLYEHKDFAKWLVDNLPEYFDEYKNDKRLQYITYIKNWWEEHSEGNPVCYDEWEENEYQEDFSNLFGKGNWGIEYDPPMKCFKVYDLDKPTHTISYVDSTRDAEKEAEIRGVNLYYGTVVGIDGDPTVQRFIPLKHWDNELIGRFDYSEDKIAIHYLDDRFTHIETVSQIFEEGKINVYLQQIFADEYGFQINVGITDKAPALDNDSLSVINLPSPYKFDSRTGKHACLLPQMPDGFFPFVGKIIYFTKEHTYQFKCDDANGGRQHWFTFSEPSEVSNFVHQLGYRGFTFTEETTEKMPPFKASEDLTIACKKNQHVRTSEKEERE